MPSWSYLLICGGVIANTAHGVAGAEDAPREEKIHTT